MQNRQENQDANSPGTGARSDLSAMWQSRLPVQTIGPDVTTTLYAVDGQARLAVDFGNRPSLDIDGLLRDGIIVDG